MHHDETFQLTSPTARFDAAELAGMTMIGMGLLSGLVAAFGVGAGHPLAILSIGFLGIVVGALTYFARYLKRPAGINNDGVWFNSATKGLRGLAGWTLGVVFTGFYIILYWHDAWLSNLIPVFDPLSLLLKGNVADKWFVYGACYTLAVLVMGVRMMYKYRHNRYQLVRTLSVMFFQLGFAFILPSVLVLLNKPEFYFTYFWPLKYDYLWPGTIGWLSDSGAGLGFFMIVWGAVMFFIATPILTYFFGKRWYCSWVCGCGGLAETLGDPFRHLSDKSMKAWKFERWSIHLVVVFVVLTTAALWINSASEGALLGGASGMLARWYGFGIGLVFAGVAGTGFYPILGNRVWCRFGCPMAAVLGMLQKWFSRFRITTNGGQCISCGNCSTYCEMGIDVRWYAQRGQNIVRSSCVGCGICAAVCPRGVLKLENGPLEQRYNGPVLIHNDHVSVRVEAAGSTPKSRRLPGVQEDIPILGDHNWDQ
jgi:ferredoxin-type protein NapH